MNTCANCGDKIGALEKPVTWDSHVVCASCYTKLSTAAAPAPAALEKGQIKCPFCHKVVKPEKKAKGDTGTAVILLALGIIPGVIYIAKNSGYVMRCPECKTKVADALD